MQYNPEGSQSIPIVIEENKTKPKPKPSPKVASRSKSGKDEKKEKKESKKKKKEKEEKKSNKGKGRGRQPKPKIAIQRNETETKTPRVFNIGTDSRPEDIRDGIEHLKDFGYAVFRGAATGAKVNELTELFWDYMEALSPVDFSEIDKIRYKIRHDRHRISRHDHTTWINEEWPGILNIATLKYYGIGASPFMWECRKLPAIRRFYEAYFHTDKLLTSLEGCSVTRGAEHKFIPETASLHINKNVRTHPNLPSIRGALVLTDCTNPTETGSLAFVERSHHHTKSDDIALFGEAGNNIKVPGDHPILANGTLLSRACTWTIPDFINKRHAMQRGESEVFTFRGWRWKLICMPGGNPKNGGDNFNEWIAMYLALVDTLGPGKSILANFWFNTHQTRVNGTQEVKQGTFSHRFTDIENYHGSHYLIGSVSLDHYIQGGKFKVNAHIVLDGDPIPASYGGDHREVKIKALALQKGDFVVWDAALSNSVFLPTVSRICRQLRNLMAYVSMAPIAHVHAFNSSLIPDGQEEAFMKTFIESRKAAVRAGFTTDHWAVALPTNNRMVISRHNRFVPLETPACCLRTYENFSPEVQRLITGT